MKTKREKQNPFICDKYPRPVTQNLLQTLRENIDIVWTFGKNTFQKIPKYLKTEIFTTCIRFCHPFETRNIFDKCYCLGVVCFVFFFLHLCLSQSIHILQKKIPCGPTWIYFSPPNCEGYLRAKLKITAQILKQVDQSKKNIKKSKPTVCHKQQLKQSRNENIPPKVAGECT